MLRLLVEYLLFFLLLLTYFSTSAQKQVHLEIVALDTTAFFIEKNCTYPKSISDSSNLKSTLQNIVQQFQQKAFLETNIDSLVQKDSLYTAYLHLGKSYQWLALQNSNIPEKWLQALGFQEKSFQKKTFFFPKLLDLQENILRYAEDNGYPFAKIHLDSITIQQGNVTAFLFLDKGRNFTIEKLDIQGEVEIAPYYLERYLGIELGAPFNKAFIKKISDRLRELPFLRESRPPLVVFKGSSAIIKIYLKKQNASRFDLLLGVQPTTGDLGVQRRIALTGTANINFQNQFGRAERFAVDFQRLTAQTQQLKLEAAYPYLFKLPFGVEAKADYYKRDTTSFTFAWDAGVQYLLQGNNYLKAFWGTTSSNLLTVNEKQITQSHRLPSILDFRYAVFGLEFLQQHLDYRFNPRRGWSVFFKGGAGQKRISKNNRIVQLYDTNDPTFDFGSLYDTLQLKTFQYKLDGRAEIFVPIFKSSTLKLGAQGGYILAANPIFQNEQYRIGGNRLLRGFDEESQFATRYVVGTLEYRFLLDKNSYFYTFGDASYIEDVTSTRRHFSAPFGFGAGMTIETKVGLLGISLAWGKRNSDPIDWRATKVHFGYVSLF